MLYVSIFDGLNPQVIPNQPGYFHFGSKKKDTALSAATARELYRPPRLRPGLTSIGGAQAILPLRGGKTAGYIHGVLRVPSGKLTELWNITMLHGTL